MISPYHFQNYERQLALAVALRIAPRRCISATAVSAVVREPRRSKRRGFTLLEVLLGMVLSIALMTGLWASLNLYMKIFRSGHLQVEQSQLIRGVLTKLSVELRATVVPHKREERATAVGTQSDSTALAPSARFDSSRCCGLRGDAHRIEIDLVEPLAKAPRTNAFDDPLATKQNTPVVPELTTVAYYVAERDLVTPVAGGASLADAAGLVRFAHPWSGHPGADPGGTQGPFSPTSLARGNAADLAEAAGDGASSGMQGLPTDASENRPQLLAAEVMQLEFRYFDGQTWTSQWDSRQSGALPRAVEVALATRRPRRASRRRTTSNETPGDPLSTNEDTDIRGVSLFENPSTTSTAEQLPWIVSRRLIALPMGGRPPKDRSTVDAATSEAGVAPMSFPETGNGGQSGAGVAP